MNSVYLSEAFKELKLLNEAEEYNLSSDPESVKDAVKMLDGDEFSIKSFDVVDGEANDEEDLQDSYEGKIILECTICHSMSYHDKEDVIIDEETGYANIDEECPFCCTEGGFKIIGQVAPYVTAEEELNVEAEEPEDTEEIKDEEKEVEEDEQEIESSDDIVEEDLSESLSAENVNNLDEEQSKLIDKICDEVSELIDNKDYTEEQKKALTIKDIIELMDNCPSTKTDDFIKTELIYGLLNNPDADIIKELFDAIPDGIKEMVARDVLGTYNQRHFQNESLDIIDESVESATVETDTDTIIVTPEEDGSMAITTEPKEEIEEEVEETEEAEMIVPLEDDVEEVIENNDEEIEEPKYDVQEVDIPIDDFDEETFDELGESYLKQVYENVNSYKTESIKEDGNKLVIEGMINFNSGNNKKTSFIFEAKDVTKSGKVRFIGENKQISRGKKAFTMTGKVNEGKFISESLNYNYRAKDTEGKSNRMYGTVRTNK